MVERVGRASTGLVADVAAERKRDGRKTRAGPRRRGRLATKWR